MPAEAIGDHCREGDVSSKCGGGGNSVKTAALLELSMHD